MKIGIFCITKDDYDTIDDFINYHYRIVGLENIIIIDNGSTHVGVINIYEKFKKKGLIVHSELGQYDQSKFWNKYINQYKHMYDFIVPLDTDEFLYCVSSRRNNEDPTDPYKILKAFLEIPINVTKCKLSEILQSCFNYKNTQCPVIEYNKFQLYNFDSNNISNNISNKYIWRSEGFVKIYNGNHNGVSNGEEDIILLGHYHFHKTGPLRDFERTVNILKGRGCYCNFEAPINIQYDNIFNNFKSFHLDWYRIKAYVKKLIEIELLEIFIKYKKKLPTIKELQTFSENVHLKACWADIFGPLTNEINEGDIPTIDEAMKSKLLFPIEDYPDDENTIYNNYLSKRLLLYKVFKD